MGPMDTKKYSEKCSIPDHDDLLPNRKYHCKMCPGRQVFKGLHLYNRHLMKIHKIEFEEKDCFHCPVKQCPSHEHMPNNVIMTKLHMVRRHYQNHHLVKKYKCQQCKRRFILKEQYFKHKCRRGLEEETDSETENDENQCVDVENIDDTMSTAEQESMDSQNDGGNSLEINDAMENYMLCWADEKRCTKCRRKYKRKHSCQEHICNLCSRIFYRKSDLAAHMGTLAHFTKEKKKVLMEDMVLIEDMQKLIRRIESKDFQDESLINTLGALVPTFQKIQDSIPKTSAQTIFK
ncbi:zinc finger protein 510 [Drosophila miranda]|uniref:zinc finger protein 510 n=1 Tax=Drosophila miranda TaxID=7229 RepID=UPI00143F2096|nr:zinc finger protein 510 [Drosophila miranda]